MKIVSAGTAAALLFLPVSSYSRRVPAEIESARLSSIVGLTVENHDGQKLGKLKNFAMDMQSGQAKYAVISSDGIMGVGSHLKVVPAKAVSTATAKKGTASLDINKRRWAKAPIFKRSELTALNDPTRSQLIARFYEHSNESGNPPTRTGSGNGDRRGTTAFETRGSARTESSSAPLQLATEISGRQLVNRENEALGTISDLLIDLSGEKRSFAVISSDRVTNKTQTFVVRLPALTLDKNKAVLDANTKQFEEAQPFDLKTWVAASAPNASAIYRVDLR